MKFVAIFRLNVLCPTQVIFYGKPTFKKNVLKIVITQVHKYISHNDIWLAALTLQNVRNIFRRRKNRLYFDKRLTCK